MQNFRFNPLIEAPLSKKFEFDTSTSLSQPWMLLREWREQHSSPSDLWFGLFFHFSSHNSHAKLHITRFWAHSFVHLNAQFQTDQFAKWSPVAGVVELVSSTHHHTFQQSIDLIIDAVTSKHTWLLLWMLDLAIGHKVESTLTMWT